MDREKLLSVSEFLTRWSDGEIRVILEVLDECFVMEEYLTNEVFLVEDL